jgi:hypothetical protein
MLTDAGPPIWSPATKSQALSGGQAQVPLLRTRQLFTKRSPGCMTLSSGTVRSATKARA